MAVIDIEKLMALAQKAIPRVQRGVLADAQSSDKKNLLDAAKVVGMQFDPRFVIDRDNETCYLNLMKWLVGDPSFEAVDPVSKKRCKGRLNAGLYIYGPTGTGKTLATKVLKQLAYNLGLRINTPEGVRPLTWKSCRCDELGTKAMLGDTLEDVKKSYVACFQDLGTEADEYVYMGNRISVMRDIISQRGEWSNLNIITSNLPIDSPLLVSKYGDRVVSRLNAMCNFIVLKGDDRRIRR